jgi:hypothetical protein
MRYHIHNETPKPALRYSVECTSADDQEPRVICARMDSEHEALLVLHQESHRLEGAGKVVDWLANGVEFEVYEPGCRDTLFWYCLVEHT